jgi:UDP-glucose 4-epimerase
VLENRSIFITGGAGFIGSRLAAQLVARNDVTLFDNLERNALVTAGVADHPRLRLLRGDVRDRATVAAAMRGHTHVVHCAAIAGIDTVIRSPVKTMDVNVSGSATVLAAANELETCERVVCISTSEIFGRRAYRSAESDEASIGPAGAARWTYAVGKLAEEHWAIAYHAEYGLPTTVLRPFNVYGPGQVGEGALRMFVERAIEGRPIEIHGDGSQIRAWCFIDDMIRALMAALEAPRAVGETFNIGNSRAVCTIATLASTVVRITCSPSSVTFVERDEPDVELRIPDVSKARDLLGFEAEVDLEEGIERTAAWARERQGAVR